MTPLLLMAVVDAMTQAGVSRRVAVGSVACEVIGARANAAVEEAKLTTFRDPLFELTYPSDFFAIRRTISGDVVRRGGVIFTSGRLATAEIVTVERFPVSELLKQADATSFFPDGAISKWSDLGTPTALATYVCERRDNEASIAAQGQQPKARASVAIDDTFFLDGPNLQLDVLTTIGATEMRVGESGARAATPGIRRIQRARLVLLPGGKTVMGCWAGCLDDFWRQGEGAVLGDVVASFTPNLTADAA